MERKQNTGKWAPKLSLFITFSLVPVPFPVLSVLSELFVCLPFISCQYLSLFVGVYLTNFLSVSTANPKFLYDHIILYLIFYYTLCITKKIHVGFKYVSYSIISLLKRIQVVLFDRINLPLTYLSVTSKPKVLWGHKGAMRSQSCIINVA